jgi:lipoprotein-releasing system permease protein
MMFFLLIFVVIVAAFSISASLITFVIKKIKEIGLLKAMGASNSMILAVFTLKGLVVGVTGTIFGTIIGIAAIYWRNEFMFALRRFTGIEIFPKKFYFFSELPASIRLEDLVIIWILSISLCIIGALLPSFCAASIDPAKALRYE